MREKSFIMIENTTKLILINKFIYESGENIKSNSVGKVAIIAATRRRKMLDTAENISGMFNIPIIRCDYLDTENIESVDYPGFIELEKIEADTIVVIANSTYLGALRSYLDMKYKISYANLIGSGGKALMIDRTDPVTKYVLI